MRASPKKNIKIDDKEISKTDIGHVKAVCRSDTKYDGAFYYIVDFPKIGCLEIRLSMLDVF